MSVAANAAEFGGPLEIPARQASCPTAVCQQNVQKQKVNLHYSGCKPSRLRQTKAVVVLKTVCKF